MSKNNVSVVKSDKLSKPGDDRFVIVSECTGEVLDDAQGYGYKSKRNAYAAYSYKSMSKSERKQKFAKERRIQNWLKEHKSFVRMLDDYAFYALKDNEEFGAAQIKSLLEHESLEIDFTPAELLKVWKK